MGASPRIIDPKDLAGMISAQEGPSRVIAAVQVPVEPPIGAPQNPEMRQENEGRGLESLVLQSPKPPEPGGLA